jgi:hypothetical protein
MSIEIFMSGCLVYQHSAWYTWYKRQAMDAGLRLESSECSCRKLAKRRGEDELSVIYRGGCHCGAVSAEYETDAPVRLRQDGCGFCRARGVKSASDPHGRLMLTARRTLIRYRFGHKSADFLICPGCGTYVATSMPGPNGPVGVINVVGLDIPELRDEPATLSSLEGETPEERVRRRLSRWTPMTLNEPGSES